MVRLQHRFSPRRIRLGSANNAPLDGGEGGTTLFLVGRELCLFLALDASKVPLQQRKAFATLAVRRAAPFPDPSFDVSWHPDGTAAIWYWSQSRIAALAQNAPGRRKRFSAEALYFGPPRSDGVDLLQFSAGVEARVWKAGQLLVSRYWPQSPTPSQWQFFLRGASVSDEYLHSPPEPTLSSLERVSWSRRRTDIGTLQLSGLDQYLPKAAIAVAALTLLLTGFELGSIARAQADIWRSQAAASKLDAPLKRILDARDATDSASAEITSLLALHGRRPVTSLMAELTRLMPNASLQVSQWNQPTPDTVEIRMTTQGANPEQLVSAWEASPMFENVTTELGRDNDLVIKATISPPPSAPNEGEAAP